MCTVNLPHESRISQSGRRGFSIPELLVVIGIIFMLVAFFMPALARSYSQARLTRDMSLVRQHAALIGMYASDTGGMYPFSGMDTPFNCARSWSVPILNGGYAERYADIEPDVSPEYIGKLRYSSFWLSMAMVYDADLMRPGQVPPTGDQHAVPVRRSEVLFPSAKGLVLRVVSPHHVNGDPDHFFCCGELWRVPVAFDDGSAVSGTYEDFLGSHPVYRENGIGMPVFSTWFGVRGRDR